MSNILQHRDYQGEVKFDGEHLVIRILHIDDFITTEVDRASEAQRAFEELVDDYIESCAEVGRQPCKPFKGSFNVRMTPKLHRQAAFAAAADGETLNGFVVNAIEQQLHSNQVETISNSVVRTMAKYLMDHSQQRRASHQWKVMDMDFVPVVEVPSRHSLLTETIPNRWPPSLTERPTLWISRR